MQALFVAMQQLSLFHLKNAHLFGRLHPVVGIADSAAQVIPVVRLKVLVVLAKSEPYE